MSKKSNWSMARITLSIKIEDGEFLIEDWQFYHVVLKRGVAEERRIAEFLGERDFATNRTN